MCIVLCVYSGEGEGWGCGECVLCCVCTVEKVRGGSVLSVCCAVCVYTVEKVRGGSVVCVYCAVCVYTVEKVRGGVDFTASLEFRSTSCTGLLLYTASSTHPDHLALEIVDGLVCTHTHTHTHTHLYNTRTHSLTHTHTR